MLCGHYTEKGAPALRAGADILSQVERIPSLGTEPFDERVGDNKWSLMMAVPPTIFHQDKVESWSGLKLKINLYKIGDNLSKRHYLSWQPIDTPQPCFHCPEFFKEVELE
jgi:hypothetical protein